MFGRLIYFTTVGIIIAQDVTCKLDYHHLHTQTNAECGNIVRTSIVGSNDFPFDTALPEPWTDHNTV